MSRGLCAPLFLSLAITIPSFLLSILSTLRCTVYGVWCNMVEEVGRAWSMVEEVGRAWRLQPVIEDIVDAAELTVLLQGLRV